MCMDSLGREVTIHRPRRVWKVVKVTADGFAGPYTDHLYQTGLNHTRGYTLHAKGKRYTEYFGCFPTRKAAEESAVWYYHNEALDVFIIPCTIPAGTKIRHGRYERPVLEMCTPYPGTVPCLSSPALEFPDYQPYFRRWNARVEAFHHGKDWHSI